MEAKKKNDKSVVLKKLTEDKSVPLSMTFEEVIKKAANTPIKNSKAKKK